MISGTNPQRNAWIALLSAIALHFVLIASAAVWLAPSVNSARQRDTVLIVALRHAAAPSAPAIAPAATTAAVTPPKFPPPAQAGKPALPVPRQKSPPRPPAARQKPASHALDHPGPPAATPPPAIVASAPSATPSRAPSLPPSPAPSDTQAAAPATSPEAAPAATSTGVAIPAAYAARNRKPDYPLMSRRYNEQGTVVLRVLVKADGSAGEVFVRKSSGYPLLDQSALTAVRDWRFAAATRDGKPVSEWYEIPIPYTLRD